MPSINPAIVILPDAAPLERFAAEELQRYFRLLWGMETPITHGPGAEQTHRFMIGGAAAVDGLPRLSDQGHAVWRASENTIAIAGGSPAAVGWGVYELLEQYGVRYLMHDDVIPAGTSFHLPDVRLVREPRQRLRCWRQFNELATCGVIWSLRQQKQFLHQLFKLKFNGIYLSIWPHQPAVDFEIGGIRRTTAAILFGQTIPVDRETIGYQHLWKGDVLDNPELSGLTTFDERCEALRGLLHGILAQAKSFGMHTALAVNALEFPKEFKPLLQKPTEESIQMGDLTCAERGDLLNPGHLALVERTLCAYIHEYAEVDEIYMHTPEHPQADGSSARCWEDLRGRFDISPELQLDAMIDRARRFGLTPFGQARAEREIRSAATMLHFVERFASQSRVLEAARARNTRLGLSMGAGFTELLPAVPRVLWPDAPVLMNLGYTASRSVRRVGSLRNIDASKMDLSLIFTLQDDNIGSMPQVATPQLEILLGELGRLNWRGYFTRHWPIGDLDPVAAFLAKASWDPAMTTQDAYADHFAAAYGAANVRPFLHAMRLMEDATVILDLDFLGLIFPVLRNLIRFIEQKSPMAEGLIHVRAMYIQAKSLVNSVDISTNRPDAKARRRYMDSRINFAIEAINEIEALCDADVHIAQAIMEAARNALATAAAAGRRAMHATADNVRDDSDRATLAIYHQIMVREIEAYLRNLG